MARAGLSRDQERAIQAMVDGLSPGEVASAAGVSRAKIDEWLADPAFRSTLVRRRRSELDSLVSGLEKALRKPSPHPPAATPAPARAASAVSPPAPSVEPERTTPSVLLEAARAASAPTPAPTPMPPELSYARALVLVQEAPDQDSLGSLLVRYVRRHWQRACLFVQRKSGLEVWLAEGESLSPELSKRPHLRSYEGTPVGRAISDGKAYHGAWPRGLGEAFQTQLGDIPRPKDVFVLPIVIGGRVACVLYADSGTGEAPHDDVSGCYLLGEQAAQAFARIAREKKAKG